MKNKVLILLLLLFTVCIQAQQSKTENQQYDLKIKLKGKANPDIYVDGKKFDFPLNLIDQDKIASINVIKKDVALKQYKTSNGVVLITTKNETSSNIEKLEKPTKGEPVMIIDGEISTKMAAAKLSPNNIKSVNVIKGEEAVKNYSAPNGVVIITTKKK